MRIVMITYEYIKEQDTKNIKMLESDLEGLKDVVKESNKKAYEILFETHHDSLHYPYKIEDVCKRLGLRIERTNMISHSGHINIQEKTIYINNQDSKDKQRFTIAHELGHYVFNNSNIKNRNANKYYTEEEKAEERLCNTFAGILLLPKIAIDEFFKIYKENTKDYGLYPPISTLSKYFKVPQRAVVIRLSILGFYIKE